MYKKIISVLLALTILLYPALAYGIAEVPLHEAAQADIISVTLTPATHVAGNIQSVSVVVSTANVADGTSITASLLQGDGITAVTGVAMASGEVRSNTSTLLLSIPATIGAGSYKVKVSMDSLNINKTANYTISPGAQPSISGVTATPNSHTSGSQQIVAVSVVTGNVSNTPAVNALVQLVDGSGVPVPGVSGATATISNNAASANLTIPFSIAAGSYLIKVTAAGVSNSDTVYTIASQTSTPDITQVTLSTLRQNVGESKTITVTVRTQQIPDGSAFTLALVDSNSAPVQGVSPVSGTISSNTGAAQITIPASSTPAVYAVKASITVNSEEKTKQSSAFVIEQPGITVGSVSTAGASLIQGSISGNMSVTGTNFSPVAANDRITLINSATQAQTTVTVSAATETSLTATIPTTLAAGTYNVMVTVNGKSATSSSTIVITPPAPTPTTAPDNGGGNTTPSPTSTPSTTPTLTPTPTPKPSVTPVPTGVPTPTPTPAIPANIYKNVVAGTTAIAKEPDLAKATELTLQLIEQTAADTGTLAGKNTTMPEIANALNDAINALLAKVNTQTVTAANTGTTVKTVLGSTEIAAIKAKLDKILALTADVNKELAAGKLHFKAESELRIKMNVKAGTTKADIQIPASLLKLTAEKKVDRITVDLGVASMSLNPSAITGGANDNIVLSAAKVNTSSLTSAVRKVIGTSPVYDFGATIAGKKVTSFKKPVEIAIPYTLTTGQDPNRITVYFINDKGQLENRAGKYDAATRTVIFTTDHFSKYVIKTNSMTFSDVKATSAYAKYIEAMAAKGLMKARTGTQFSPDSYVTRGELAELLVNTFKLGNPSDKTLKSSFKDVKSTTRYFGSIILASKAGLMNGNKNGTFNPNGLLSRQDAAVLFANAAKLYKQRTLPVEPDKLLTFADKAKIAAYAKPSVALMAEFRLMDARSQNNFAPTANITRAELAKLLYMFLEL